EGASSVRGELQLPALPAWAFTLRKSNEKTRSITVPFLLVGNFLCRRNQEHQHHDFRDGLRSLCTRRARVIESCTRSGHSRRESGEGSGYGEDEAGKLDDPQATERSDSQERFHDEGFNGDRRGNGRHHEWQNSRTSIRFERRIEPC